MATRAETSDLAAVSTEFRATLDVLGRPRAAAATEFGAALTTLGIKQRTAAQWFRTSERNIRRWKSGTRRTPPGVMVTVRLMMAGKVRPADVELAATSAAEVELAAVPAPAGTNGGAKPRPPAPRLVEPAPAALTRIEAATFVEPAPAGPSRSTAEQVFMLGPSSCRWCYGDPGRPDFHFCGRPVAVQPYCREHRRAAYVTRSPASDIPRRGTCTLAPAGAN